MLNAVRAAVAAAKIWSSVPRAAFSFGRELAWDLVPESSAFAILLRFFRSFQGCAKYVLPIERNLIRQFANFIVRTTTPATPGNFVRVHASLQLSTIVWRFVGLSNYL